MPLAIEIRLRSIFLVQTVVTKSKIHIKKTAVVDLQEGWVDAKGINDLSAVTAAVSQALNNNGIQEKKINLCINNPSIIYRELTIPKIEDKRIPFVVRSEMIASLDLKRDHVVDFVLLDEMTENHKTQLRVLGVAISQQALSSYVDFCFKLGSKPEVIETATTSLIRLVDRSKIASDGQPLIVADVEADVLKLYLFEGNKYILIRNTRLIQSEGGNQDPVIGHIEDDINKMMQHQFTRESHLGVQKVVFLGNHPLLKQVAQSVNVNLSVDTELYPNPEFLGAKDGLFHAFLYPIGASLRK